MSITDKTRKILWVRSGNKCAICNTELVTKQYASFPTTVLGEECHIISAVANGPRYTDIPDFNYDAEDNLILLCPICHKIVDLNVTEFLVGKLKKIKEIHTEKIRLLLGSEKDLFDGITMLPKINTGKELMQLLQDVHGFEYDFEDTSNLDEINFMTGIMSELEEYVDYLSFVTELSEKLSTIPALMRILTEIEEHKFGLFGDKKRKSVTVQGHKMDDWLVCTFFLMKLDNPNVVPVLK